MANTQINVKANGITTLSTAGKYCDRNIDVNVNVQEVHGVPDYVIAESKEVIERVNAAQTGSRVFTLAAISDMHYGRADEVEKKSYPDGIKHAFQAPGYISGKIRIDALSVHGDYLDYYMTDNLTVRMADVYTINNMMSGIGVDKLVLLGNHDFYAEGNTIVANATTGKSDNVVWGDQNNGYYYRDFADHKLRIVSVNTSETGGGNICCSNAQYNWFISALDLSAKLDASEWQILILSHHPIDWYEGASDGVYRFGKILKAYVNGSSWSGGGLSCNFIGKNAARIVGNIHGHIHNFLVGGVHVNHPVNNDELTGVYRICVPTSCINSHQEYDGFKQDTIYEKTKNTAEDTAFTIFCIDLDNHMIKAINYGAGIDRELLYYDPSVPTYTNMLTKAVGTDGKPFNGGKGWIKGYRINSSGAQAENSDYYITGYIPVKDRDTIYLKDMNFINDGTTTQPNTRIATYTSSFALKRVMLSGDAAKNAMFNAVMLNEDGGTLQIGDAIGKIRLDTYDTDCAYVRFSTKKIDDTSIVTVNEPII